MFALGELNSDSPKEATVMCPAGEVATGGGFNFGVTAPDMPIAFHLSSAVLAPDNRTPIGWTVRGVEVVPTADAWRPVATAVCVPAG